MTTPLTFSVIINTCDRAEPLRTLLDALNQQTYAHFEVIVVIGPTKDDSVAVVQTFGERVILAHCPEFNLSMSRNIGIAIAVGDIVAFIDDDALPCPTWLEQLATCFENRDIAGAGGRVYQIHPGHGQLQFRHGLFSIFAEDADVRDSPTAPLPTDTPPQYWYPRLMGTNMAYRRQALTDGGGFDERFAYLFEEPDLAIRLGRQGYKIQHLDEAVVYHAPASSRNRQMFTWNINWYMWMRGGIYFILKNSSPLVGRRVAWLRAMQYAQKFFTRVRNHRTYDSLPADLYPDVIKQLWRGLGWGLAVGLFGQRQIATHFGKPNRDFQPFLKEIQELGIRNQESAQSKMEIIQNSVLPSTTATNYKSVASMEAPLRICLLSSNYPPHSTEGVARLTHVMAQGLAELGHEVHVIIEGRANHTTFYDGAYVHEIRTESRYYQHYNKLGYSKLAWLLNHSHVVYEKLKSLRLNHQIQLVDSTVWLLESLVMAVAQEMPIVTRLVTSTRQLNNLADQVEAEAHLISQLEEQLLRQSHGLVPISQAIKQTYTQIYGLDFTKRPHQIIHAGIKPLPEEAVFPLDGQAKPAPILLFVGRLEKRKGILTLFEAMPQVLREFPQAQFWLAGKDNSPHDGFADAEHLTYPQYFQKKYPACQNQVKFLGYVADDKLAELYQICDLFVAPSLYESFGLIFLEAMNQARPVIGCNVGGPTEIIVPNETGLLVTPEAPTELATAIIQLLSQPKARRDMGRAGRERLLKQFHYLKMAEQYVAFYGQLIDK